MSDGLDFGFTRISRHWGFKTAIEPCQTTGDVFRKSCFCIGLESSALKAYKDCYVNPTRCNNHLEKKHSNEKF